jgi:hypothetical protein
MVKSTSQLLTLSDRLMIGASLTIATLALMEAGRLMALPAHFV